MAKRKISGEAREALKKVGLTDEAVAELRDKLGVQEVGHLEFITAERLVDLESQEILPIQAEEMVASLKATFAPVAEAPSMASMDVFELPDELAKRMEDHAESLDDPVGEEFFELRNMVVSRSYAEVLSALGIKGTFMSEARKNRFLARLEDDLWDALQGFQSQLHAWQRSWMEGTASPAMMVGMFAAAASGGALPPGMMAPPDTSTLRDAAEGVVDQVNKIFAGVGIPVARALAYDVHRIREVLENKNLPPAVGATSHEHMLKILDVDVSSDYVRLERNIARYTLAVMELPKITAGQEEIVYLGAMLQLGLSIPWDRLQATEEGRPGGGAARPFSTGGTG
jgi:hypothetical protein